MNMKYTFLSFCKDVSYCNALLHPLFDLQPHSTNGCQNEVFCVKHQWNFSFLAHTELVPRKKIDQSHFCLHQSKTHP